MSPAVLKVDISRKIFFLFSILPKIKLAKSSLAARAEVASCYFKRIENEKKIASEII